MLSFSQLPWFLTASLVLLLTPGPAVLYLLARSLHHGRRAGVLSALGLATGTFVHVLMAAAGLSALVVSSALAFTVVKSIGAAYLIALGVWPWIPSLGTSGTRPASGELGQPLPLSWRHLVGQGVMVNVLNPKLALFFLAFLPQFADLSRGQVPLQMLLLGSLFVLLGLATDSSYALLAGSLGTWLQHPSRSRWPQAGRYWTTAVYVGLGVSAALARPET